MDTKEFSCLAVATKDQRVLYGFVSISDLLIARSLLTKDGCMKLIKTTTQCCMLLAVSHIYLVGTTECNGRARLVPVHHDYKQIIDNEVTKLQYLVVLYVNKEQRVDNAKKCFIRRTILDQTPHP